MQSDEELAAAIATGSTDAFEQFYDRHVPALYDMAYRLLRGPEAEDVVQETFFRVWERLQGGEAVRNVRAWLFTIAHNAALDVIRARKRVVPADAAAEDDTASLASLESDPEASPEQIAMKREAADLVWDAAAGLSPSEYALLDLQVRRGLTVDEMAECLGGIRSGAIYTRLSRLRDSLEESVTSILLMRHGRAQCSGLDALLQASSTPQIDTKVRRTVYAHAQVCPQCRRSRQRFVSPTEILAGLSPVLLPPELRRLLWERIEEGARFGGASSEIRGPSHRRQVLRKVPKPAVVVIAAGVVATSILVPLIRSSPESSRAAMSRSSTTGSSTTTSVAPLPTPPTPPPTDEAVMAGRYRVMFTTASIRPLPHPPGGYYLTHVGKVTSDSWVVTPTCPIRSCGFRAVEGSDPGFSMAFRHRSGGYVFRYSSDAPCTYARQRSGHLHDHHVQAKYQLRVVAGVYVEGAWVASRFRGTVVTMWTALAEGLQAGCFDYTITWTYSGRLTGPPLPPPPGARKPLLT